MPTKLDIQNPLEYIPQFFKVQTKAGENGVSDLVPMKLWPTQAHYIEHRTNRDVVLKNRQTGMSTGILAGNSHAFFTRPNERQTIITHDDETSEFLLRTVHRFFHNLPQEIKPDKGHSAAHRISLGKFDSYMYIDSARSDSIGIGHGLTRAHLSECSKWPARKEQQLFADISQTVPAGGFITIESTPRGRGGLFYQLYEAAKRGDINYKYFFFPWWWDVTCVFKIESKLYYDSLADKACSRLNLTRVQFDNEEKLLIENAKLSPEQVAFRRIKQAELGEMFYQEYPESDVDCWLSSDVNVFDGVAIRRYLQETQQGRHEGNITIWNDVLGGEKYVIGADPAGGYEKGDYSVGAVIRVRTNTYVARLRGKLPPDMFAQELMRLGRRYNDAEIAVEKIMHGHSVLRVLLEADYPDIYHYEDYDSYTGGMSMEPGWKTSAKTKPLMIDTFNSSIRAHDLIAYSENLMLEASGLMWDGEKKTRKPSGGYDDEVDAVMIALMVRDSAPIYEPSEKSKIKSYARY